MMKKLLLVILLGVFITGICFAQISQDKQDNIICDDSTGTDDIDPQEIKQILNDLGGNIFPSQSDSIYPPFNWEPYEDVPEPIEHIIPQYPEFAKAAGIQGTVILEVNVYKDGTVGRITVMKSLMAGPGGLDEAAIDAVRKWKFEPGKSGGKPIDTTVLIPIEFTLRSASQLKSIVLPDYPDSLVQAGVHGTVTMRADITKDGRVVGIRLIDSVFDDKCGLNANAMDAFGKWKFVTLNTSTLEESAIRVEVTFKIPDLRDWKKKWGWHNIKVGYDSIVVPIILKEDESYDNPPFTVNPKLPKYPAFSYSTGIEGIVILEADIDKYGIPDNIKVLRSLLSGPGGLDKAAIETVKQWRFTPALKNGYPVDVTIHLPIEFIWANRGKTQ